MQTDKEWRLALRMSQILSHPSVCVIARTCDRSQLVEQQTSDVVGMEKHRCAPFLYLVAKRFCSAGSGSISSMRAAFSISEDNTRIWSMLDRYDTCGWTASFRPNVTSSTIEFPRTKSELELLIISWNPRIPTSGSNQCCYRVVIGTAFT